MTTNRRKAREEAVQVLYQLDMNRTLNLEAGLRYFSEHFSDEKTVDEFVRLLVLGVTEKVTELDEILASSSQHWKMDRMTAVDRNILRLGVFELKFRDDIPSTVTLNEMVELAKIFGTANSSAFINGVLDSIAATHCPPQKAP